SPLRLAFPTYADADTDEIVDRFDSVCSVLHRARLDIAGGADLVELRANGLDAKMVYAVNRETRVGGVYFSGSDALLLCFGVQTALRYFPVSLARALVQRSRFAEHRVAGLFALGMSEMRQILPRESTDADTFDAVHGALSDPNPTVRTAALQMKLAI